MQRDQELPVQTRESKRTGLADPGLWSRLGPGNARGAIVVASLTIVSRILGLVRTLVFSQTVGASCLGTAYVTANQVPDLLYQLILGGALGSVLVPVLARSAERAAVDPAEKARVGQISSAMLTWTVIIVVPLSLAIAAVAGPIASLLIPANAHVLAKQPGQVPQLIWAFALFTPGIAGTAVIANMARVMFVIRRLKVATVALAGSWLLVIVIDVVLVQLVPARLVPAALALRTTISQSAVATIPLVFVAGRICGPAAVRGVGHAALAELAACAAGAAVGLAVSLAVPVRHKLEAVALALPAAGCAILALGVVAYLLDNGDVRSVLGWVRRVARLRL